jgi:hypothetical protein
LSEEEAINQIKNHFLSTVDPVIRRRLFDDLEEYNDKGIAMINELMGTTANPDLKMHGLDVIKRIKSKIKTDTSKPWEIEGDLSSDEDEEVTK